MESHSLHTISIPTKFLLTNRLDIKHTGDIEFSITIRNTTVTLMNKLIQLHADIDARVNAIRDSNTNWQCKMGCDGCCQRLAEIPQLTTTEWDLLRDGLSDLPPETFQEISLAVTTLTNRIEGFVVCPMLDKSKGACRVYAHRPVACRTYGYYVQHDKGLYCNDILERVTSGVLNDVVWGNQNTIDRQLNGFGDSKDLTEWFEHCEGTRLNAMKNNHTF